MKKYLIMFIMLLIPYSVKASCSDDELMRIQKLANNINISYEYNETLNKFKVTFSNVNPSIYIKDAATNKKYYSYSEIQINNVASGDYTYYIYSRDNNCYENELGVKTIKLPYYNKYYNNEECKNIKHYKYCSKWLTNNMTYENWKKNITEYMKNMETEEEKKETKTNKTILDDLRIIMAKLYTDYYYFILPITIVVLCIIIYLKNKSDQII